LDNPSNFLLDPSLFLLPINGTAFVRAIRFGDNANSTSTTNEESLEVVV
jgi:hypothetical protein